MEGQGYRSMGEPWWEHFLHLGSKYHQVGHAGRTRNTGRARLPIVVRDRDSFRASCRDSVMIRDMDMAWAIGV